MMSYAKVKDYFEQYGMQDRVRLLDDSSATVELAAKALNCEESRIAKTISLLCVDESILIVTSGDKKIDNSKYRQEFGIKAKMIPYEQVESLIGHSVGGVCPFAINSGVKVYLDESLKRFDTVFPACGSSNSVIELSIEELVKYSSSIKWIDVSK